MQGKVLWKSFKWCSIIKILYYAIIAMNYQFADPRSTAQDIPDIYWEQAARELDFCTCRKCQVCVHFVFYFSLWYFYLNFPRLGTGSILKMRTQYLQSPRTPWARPSSPWRPRWCGRIQAFPRLNYYILFLGFDARDFHGRYGLL